MAEGRLQGLVERLRSLYPVRLALAFGESQAPNYAAGLAFNMFMSMFPLLLGLLAIVGLVLRSPTQQAAVESTVLSFFPPDAQAALHRTLTGVRDHAGLLGVISVLGLIWSGSGLFTSMEFALGQIFGAPQRDFVRQRLMALFMTAVFVVAIVVSAVASASLAFIHGVPFVGPVIGFLTWFVFMLVIYRVVPNRTFSTQDHVWPGALLAGALMEVLTLVWPLFARLMHGFDTYGSTFALFFLLATWLYLLAQVLLLGAVASRMGQGTPRKEGLAASPQPEIVKASASER